MGGSEKCLMQHQMHICSAKGSNEDMSDFTVWCCFFSLMYLFLSPSSFSVLPESFMDFLSYATKASLFDIGELHQLLLFLSLAWLRGAGCAHL